MTNITLEGVYNRVNSKFHKEGITLMVADRKNPTPKKPLNFLVAILPDGRRRFISSMYQTVTQNRYNIDWNGVQYTFTSNASNGVIEQGHDEE